MGKEITVMKRKSLLLILILFTSNLCFSYNMEEFYELSPEEQVDLWIEEYANRETLLGVTFRKTNEHFCKAENISIYAPLLIDKLRETDIGEYYYDSPNTFKMIDENLMRICKSLSKDVRNEVAEIYREKIYGHVLKYGKIDKTVYVIIPHIIYFEEGIEPSPYGFNPYELKAKYEAEGIENVNIDWEETGEQQLLTKKRFNPSDKTEFFKGCIKEYNPSDRTLIGNKGQCAGTVFYTEGNRVWEYIDLEKEDLYLFYTFKLELFFNEKDKGGVWKLQDVPKIRREDDDWRPPTLVELNWIYNYLVETGTERPEKWYWSSERIDGKYYYVQRLSDGKLSNNYQANECSIILVRTYNTDPILDSMR